MTLIESKYKFYVALVEILSPMKLLLKSMSFHTFFLVMPTSLALPPAYFQSDPNSCLQLTSQVALAQAEGKRSAVLLNKHIEANAKFPQMTAA